MLHWRFIQFRNACRRRAAPLAQQCVMHGILLCIPFLWLSMLVAYDVVDLCWLI